MSYSCALPSYEASTYAIIFLIQVSICSSIGKLTASVGLLIKALSSKTSQVLVGWKVIDKNSKVKIILTIEVNNQGRIFVITGPSGVGKSTLVKALLDHFKEQLFYSISATTRKKRISEKEGIDYFFKDKDEFENLIKQDAFIEWACYNNHYYGTLKSQAEQAIKSGINLMLEIEYQGALQVKSKYPHNVVLIFIKPPSMQELLKRLKKRNDEDETTIKKRLEQAKIEFQQIDNFKYVVTNKEFDKTLNELKSILLSEFI
nr:guanylate kinase (EC 2.7.4.8) - Mycoplasma genitalium [Mycoplasmoides genitalium]